MVWLTVSVPGAISGSAARGAEAGIADARGEEGVAGEAGGDLAAAGARAPSPLWGEGWGEGAFVAAPPASPSSTAIGVLTFTPSVPAGISSFDTLPSSEASTSMVALSVSISAMTSPALMVWPSDQPLGELALLHGGRQRGHQDLGRHFLGSLVVGGGQTPRLHDAVSL